MLFNSELALVNRELMKKWPYLEPYMAQYSGQAHWVRILRRRIDRVMNVSTWPFPNLGLRGMVVFRLCHMLGEMGDLSRVSLDCFHDQRVNLPRGMADAALQQGRPWPWICSEGECVVECGSF